MEASKSQGPKLYVCTARRLRLNRNYVCRIPSRRHRCWFVLLSFWIRLFVGKYVAPSWIRNPLQWMGQTLRSKSRPNKIAPARRFISFSPTCSLLLPRQASPTGSLGGEADNPVVSTPHRLRTSEIPKPRLVSLVLTPPRHHLPAVPSDIGELRQCRY